MAGDKTFAELEADVAQKYAKRLQDNWKREQKLIQYDSFRGSKYPPFNIEHLPHERQRLSTPMTAEDRVLRKQWLHDQHLSPNEPVNVPELKPRNFIRRLYGKPWDALFKVLRPVIGEGAAANGRFFIPKLSMAVFLAYFSYYNLKYNYATWETRTGWHVYSNRATLYPNQGGFDALPVKEHTDFADKDFSKRTFMKDQ